MFLSFEFGAQIGQFAETRIQTVRQSVAQPGTVDLMIHPKTVGTRASVQFAFERLLLESRPLQFFVQIATKLERNIQDQVINKND